MRRWFPDLVLGHIKLFSTELFCKKKSIFYTISCKIPFKILSKLLFLYISFIFCNLKKIKSNSLVTVWNALGLSHQTTVSLNYSQSIKINIGPSDGEMIISSSRRPTVLYQRLTEYKWNIQVKMVCWVSSVYGNCLLQSELCSKRIAIKVMSAT